MYKKLILDPRESIWDVMTTTTNATMKHKKTVNRMVQYICFHLRNYWENVKMYRLRMKYIYEAESNLLLKIYWPRKGGHGAEETDSLRTRQHEKDADQLLKSFFKWYNNDILHYKPQTISNHSRRLRQYFDQTK